MNPARITARLAALVGAALLGGVAGAVVVTQTDDDTSSVAVTTTVANPARSVAQTASLSDLYERVAPSVVEIQTSTGPSSDNPLAPQQGATGTGWIYDADGHVVTNEHVVENANEVTVRFDDGREVGAKVVGADPSSDVAVLELESTEGLPTALNRGSTANLEVGDPVVAIGSPFGLQGSLTSGIVSGLGRTITAPNQFGIDDVIQTDAALNPGNSGGPLLTLDGSVVGVNSQIASESGGNQGIGYAIPIDTVSTVVQQLIASGKVEHAYLGVRVGDADGGARIVQVTPGSPADDAGLEAGDVIVKADGEAVASGDDVRKAVSANKPGDELQLEVERSGDTKTVTAKLEDRPATTG